MSDNIIKIKNIKIFGERNSGTNFLQNLIIKNVPRCKIYSSYYKGGSGWKHGIPKIKLFNNLNNTLFIFIIRNLNDWIKSMYFNPYSYKKPCDINYFLNNKLEIYEKRDDHDVNIYEYEKQNIIDLRYYKIKSYFNLYNKVNNALFINLTDLQNDNKKFLLFLQDKYNIYIHKNIRHVNNHTKIKNYKKQNKNYDIVVPKIIKKNINIENFVERLEKKILL